jgi:hypothetical protein
MMDEFWSIAREFFPSEVLLARQIPSVASNAHKDSFDRVNEFASRKREALGRKSLSSIRKPKEHISFLPQPSTDNKDIEFVPLSGTIGRSIESSLQSFESNMNHFDKLYSHDRFFTRAWQDDARTQRF